MIDDVRGGNDHQHTCGLLADVTPHVRLCTDDMNAITFVKDKTIGADLKLNASSKDIEDFFAFVREKLHVCIRSNRELKEECTELRLGESP